MKYALAFAAFLALVGFVGFSHAADTKSSKPHKGHFVKLEDKVLTFKGGVKGTGKEHTVKVDDTTKVTLDGKDAKLEDLKADMYLEITEADGMASLIAAQTKTPTEAPKTEKTPEKSPK